MGRLTVVNFVSMDGVTQSPNSADEDRSGGFAHGGWVPPHSDETVAEFMRDTTVGADGMLLGRRTYQIMTNAWSGADQSEPAVAAMNRMPKYVVTRSRGELAWANSHRVAPDLPDAVVQLKDESVGDLLVLGSGELVRGLARQDLVDEYRLLLFPVLIGFGKGMFDDGSGFTTFDLMETATSPSGVVILTYARRSDS